MVTSQKVLARRRDVTFRGVNGDDTFLIRIFLVSLEMARLPPLFESVRSDENNLQFLGAII